MSKIPKHIIERHKEGVEELRFYGVPVTELEHDELLAFANLCAQQVKNASERMLEFIRTSRELNKLSRG